MRPEPQSIVLIQVLYQSAGCLQVSQQLLPTPTRSHYLFNLRDLSRVFQGILMIRAKQVQRVYSCLRLGILTANGIC